MKRWGVKFRYICTYAYERNQNFYFCKQLQIRLDYEYNQNKGDLIWQNLNVTTFNYPILKLMSLSRHEILRLGLESNWILFKIRSIRFKNLLYD